jgi:hypothetical protein
MPRGWIALRLLLELMALADPMIELRLSGRESKRQHTGGLYVRACADRRPNNSASRIVVTLSAAQKRAGNWSSRGDALAKVPPSRVERRVVTMPMRRQRRR